MKAAPPSLAERAARLLTGLAAASLVAMMAATVLDIALRQLTGRPLFGTVEIVQFTLVLTVFLAIPESFLRGEQVTVDIVDGLLPPRAVQALRAAAALLSLAFLVAMAWRMVPAALDTLEFGDTTMDLRVPLIWYWAPMILGTAAGALAMVAVVLRELARLARPT